MDFIRTILIISIIFSLTIASRSIRRYRYSLYENDFCGLDQSIYSGKCKKLSKCLILTKERRDIEVCSFGGFRGFETLVCCSRDDFFASRRLNGEGVLNFNQCMNKYKHLRDTEESFSKFVVNGEDVEPFEFSHMAAIGWLRWIDFSVSWLCGGSLITENYVLSAAHCMSFGGSSPNVVRLGDVDLNSPFDDQYVQQFGVLRTIIHPQYDNEENKNDIALIQLQGSVIPTKYVVPACLNHKPPPEYLEGAGYGQDGDGISTNKLLKVPLQQVEMSLCQESYELKLSGESQMCAKSYRDDIEQDFCYGDSGGGLQYMNTDLTENEVAYKTPVIAAITSFGIGCAYGIPGVYVNVQHYIDWMESMISP